jgi:hypothetical protein
MDPSYQPANFKPGDEVPEWAIDQVGDHVLEPEDSIDSDDVDGSEEPDESDQDQGEDSGENADGEDDVPPPADDQPDFTAPAPARRGRARK